MWYDTWIQVTSSHPSNLIQHRWCIMIMHDHTWLMSNEDKAAPLLNN